MNCKCFINNCFSGRPDKTRKSSRLSRTNSKYSDFESYESGKNVDAEVRPKKKNNVKKHRSLANCRISSAAFENSIESESEVEAHTSKPEQKKRGHPRTKRKRTKAETKKSKVSCRFKLIW